MKKKPILHVTYNTVFECCCIKQSVCVYVSLGRCLQKYEKVDEVFNTMLNRADIRHCFMYLPVISIYLR